MVGGGRGGGIGPSYRAPDRGSSDYARAKRIERINRYAEATFVVFNNDAAGKSVVNALQLESILNGHPAAAPKELRRRFPMELERFGPRHFEQQCLFDAA